MEPESSLPHPQMSATYPYPEPARSSPYPHIQLPVRSILILSFHLRLGLPNGLFPSGFPTRTLCTPLPIPILATSPTLATHHIGSRSSIRNLRTHHKVVTRTHLSHGTAHYGYDIYEYSNVNTNGSNEFVRSVTPTRQYHLPPTVSLPTNCRCLQTVKSGLRVQCYRPSSSIQISINNWSVFRRSPVPVATRSKA